MEVAAARARQREIARITRKYPKSSSLFKVPRYCWYGGRRADQKLAIPSKGHIDLTAPGPWLFIIGDSEALLLIEEPGATLAKSATDSSRSAHIITDFRILWRPATPAKQLEPSSLTASTSLPSMQQAIDGTTEQIHILEEVEKPSEHQRRLLEELRSDLATYASYVAEPKQLEPSSLTAGASLPGMQQAIKEAKEHIHILEAVDQPSEQQQRLLEELRNDLATFVAYVEEPARPTLREMRTALLNDAALIAYVCRRCYGFDPMRFAGAALAAWGDNPFWEQPSLLSINATVTDWLPIYAVYQLKGFQANRIASLSSTLNPVRLLDWLGACSFMPWNKMRYDLMNPERAGPPRGPGGVLVSQRVLNEIVEPFLQWRQLCLSAPQRVPLAVAGGRSHEESFAALDELASKATPALAAVVRAAVDEHLLTTGKTAYNNGGLVTGCRGVRGQVTDLEDLASGGYLPPCIAGIRDHGIAERKLKNDDRLIATQYLAGIGQARRLDDYPAEIPKSMRLANVVDEAQRFFLTGQPSEDPFAFRNMLKHAFGTDGDVKTFSCARIRRDRSRGVYGSGNVAACPFTKNNKCLAAAHLPETTRLIYPHQWTMLALARDGKNQ